MGHSRIGTLPATRKWKEVVSLVASGADEAAIADAVMVAAAKTLVRVRDDAGFREAMRMVMQLALAGTSRNPTGELAAARGPAVVLPEGQADPKAIAAHLHSLLVSPARRCDHAVLQGSFINKILQTLEEVS